MNLPASLAVSHNDLITKAQETKMKLEKTAMLASKRISAQAQLRKTNTGKSCSNAASASMSFTRKTTKMTLQERTATSVTLTL